ncbi:MAG: DUF721 domain-containing protein [Bacteroidia bacterium]
MYKDNQVTLKEAINQLLDTYKLKNKMKTLDIINEWSKLVGPMIAKHTRDIYLRDGVLHVKFDSSPLKQEVQMMKTKMIAHLNKELGEEVVKDLKVL